MHPVEVESVLLQLENVADVVVSGEPHALTGQIVAATVRLIHPEPPDQFKIRMRRFCGEHLTAYKVPVRLHFTDAPIHSLRFKRVRPAAPAVANASST